MATRGLLHFPFYKKPIYNNGERLAGSYACPTSALSRYKKEVNRGECRWGGKDFDLLSAHFWLHCQILWEPLSLVPGCQGPASAMFMLICKWKSNIPAWEFTDTCWLWNCACNVHVQLWGVHPIHLFAPISDYYNKSPEYYLHEKLDWDNRICNEQFLQAMVMGQLDVDTFWTIYYIWAGKVLCSTYNCYFFDFFMSGADDIDVFPCGNYSVTSLEIGIGR